MESIGTCPICLTDITAADEAFVDPCLHHFCFECIKAWVKTQQNQSIPAVTCPVCKASFSSIIYDCHDVAYRIWRIDGSCTDTRKQLQGDFGLTSEQRRRRSLYSTHYNDDSLAEETKRLQGSFINQASLGRPAVAQWLTRELQALLLQEDVELLVQHILGNLKHSIEALSVENTRLKKPGSGRVAGERAVDIVAVAMAPYLPEHAKKLGHEFIGFVVSGLNIDAHDAVVFRIKEEEEEADEEDIEEDGTELPLPPTA